MDNQNLNSETILVVGATGLVGMEVCSILCGQQRKVKALVRESSSPEKVHLLQEMGAETVIGDIKDLASLQAIFPGTTAVISTATATASRQEGDSIETVDQQGQLNVIEAALGVGVKKFVFLSVYKTTYESSLETAKRTVEVVLKETGMRYTILQPTFFMEVWLSPFLGLNYPQREATIYGDGKNKISWISLKDVAEIAVSSLDNPVAENATILLGGPASLTPLEVVAIFEKAGGKPFKVQHVPLEALQAQYAQAPDSLSKSFASLMLQYAEGSEIDMQQVMKDFEIELTTVDEYASKVMSPQTAEAVNA
jgi:uncharacterized protein YbjT (DUF2867 family)